MRPWVIGECNPYGSTDELSLYPSPLGSMGWRLCHLVLGMQSAEYLGSFERRNLLTSARWSATEAREAAVRVVAESLGAPLVLLGARVARAFRQEYRPFTVAEYSPGVAVAGLVLTPALVILPHPSGLCRAWNEDGAYRRARDLVLPLLQRGAA